MSGDPAPDRRFARFWLMQLLAQVSAKTALVMLPMIAVVVYHAGATATGVIVALQYLPVLVVAAVAGGVLDRWDRRICLTVAYLVTGGTLILVPASSHGLLRIAVLLVTCAVAGGVMTFADLCAQTVPPDLVPRSRLVEANGRLEFIFSVCLVGAPGLAGVMVNDLGGSTGLLINSVLCGLAGLVALTLRLPRRALSGAQTANRRRRGWAPRFAGPAIEQAPLKRSSGGTAAGMRILFGDRVLRLVSVQAAAFNLFEQVFLTLYLLYAIRVWGFSASLLGLTMSVGGAGTVLASLIVSKWRGAFPPVRALMAGMGLACLAPLLIPMAAGATWTRAVAATAAFLLYGFGLTLYNIHGVSLRQALTPPDALGIVSAAYRLLAFGPIGIGALLGGWAGSALGVRSALPISTVLLAASFVVFAVRLRRIREPVETALHRPADPAPLPVPATT